MPMQEPLWAFRVYGKDGFILCAWNNDENWTDYLDGIPSYLDQNTPVEKVDTVQFNGGSFYDERSLLQPSGTGRRRTNWDTAAGEHSFTVTVNFSSSTPCDITTYSFPAYSYYGREYAINVTDNNGTQTLYVHNDYNSIYCRFSVEPDENNQVVLEFVGAPTSTGYTVPRVSALFFDPQETHVTRYEYTDENYPKKVTKTIDAYGNEATTQYNIDGTVAESSNFRGKVTKYTYTGDSYARITCVEDPLGNKTWTNYDTKGRVVSTVDARGSGPDDEDHMTKNEYDDDGNLISVTDPLGNKTTYQYDSTGKLISQTDPTGWVTYYNTNDDSGTTEVKDALGRVISSTDGDGKTTNYEYDIDSHLIKITDPNGAISTNTYDAIGRMTASSDFEGNITRYEYDVMGRTTKTTAPDGGETSYEYDVKGRITKTTYPDETTTETTYDIYGNVKTTTDRAGNVSENFYDRLNRVIKIKDPEGNYTYYDYDANGNRTAVRDPRSSSATDDTYKISYTYDDNDRLTRIDYPDSTYEATVYDAVGNVISKTDRKGQTTTYTFNNANRLTVITYPDETTTEYTYDAAGRTLSVTQPDGSAIYYENNSTFRREIKLDSGGNLVYDYYWIEDTENKQSVFMDCTEATEASLPAVYDKVKYSENFNKIGYSSTAQLGQVFKYGKDGENNRRYRDGEPQQLAKFGAMKMGTGAIQYAASPGIPSTIQDYDNNTFTDQFGNIWRFESAPGESRTYYPNNTYTARTFDPDGRLKSILHKRINKGGAPGEYNTETVLESFSYQYYDGGNIKKITYANGEYTDYTYDSLNRLTSEHRKTSGEATIYKIEYKFDNNDAKNGNIHQVIVNDTDTTTFTYDEMNQLIAITHPDSSTETLTYDDNGNLVQMVNNTTGETTILEWTIFNDLSKIIFTDGHSIENQYNADGQITGQKAFSEQRTFTQKNWNITREEISVNDTEKLTDKIYTIKPDGEILSVTQNGEPFYLHTDHLGTAHFLTDKLGNKITTGLYTGYGNSLPLEKNGIPGAKENKGAKNINTLGYVAALGIRNEFRMKMQYMRSRFYSSLYHRFISVDKKKIGDNHYQYVDSNPLLNNDPFGYACYIRNRDIKGKDKEYIKIRKKLLDVVRNEYIEKWKSVIDSQSCKGMVRLAEKMKDTLLANLKCFRFAYLVDMFTLIFMEVEPFPTKGTAKRVFEDAFCIYEKFLRGYGVEFKGYCFDATYADRPSERKANQVFHYMAYLILSFKHGGLYTKLLVNLHDFPPFNQPGHSIMDLKLGHEGADVGKHLYRYDGEAREHKSGYFTQRFGDLFETAMKSVCDFIRQQALIKEYKMKRSKVFVILIFIFLSLSLFINPEFRDYMLQLYISSQHKSVLVFQAQGSGFKKIWLNFNYEDDYKKLVKKQKYYIEEKSDRQNIFKLYGNKQFFSLHNYGENEYTICVDKFYSARIVSDLHNVRNYCHRINSIKSFNNIKEFNDKELKDFLNFHLNNQYGSVAFLPMKIGKKYIDNSLELDIPKKEIRIVNEYGIVYAITKGVDNHDLLLLDGLKNKYRNEILDADDKYLFIIGKILFNTKEDRHYIKFFEVRININKNGAIDIIDKELTKYYEFQYTSAYF